MAILNEVNKWFERSACKPVLDATGNDYWYSNFDEDGQPAYPAWRAAEARVVCNRCPVRVNCLAYAMERELGYVMDSRPKTRQEEFNGPPEGIWAGYLPDQRVRLAGKLAGLTRGQRAAFYMRLGTRPVHITEKALRARRRRRAA